MNNAIAKELRWAFDNAEAGQKNVCLRKAADEIERLDAKCKKLMARLECDHAFKLVDGEMVRVEMELPEGADGISCRDATINSLEEQLGRKSKP